MRTNDNMPRDYNFGEPLPSYPPRVADPPLASGAPTTDERGDAPSAVEAYDRAAFEIVRWALRGGWLCCLECGAYGPYKMVEGRAYCHDCLPDERLFTAAEHAASEREAARPSLMELNDAVRGTPYQEAE